MEHTVGVQRVDCKSEEGTLFRNFMVTVNYLGETNVYSVYSCHCTVATATDCHCIAVTPQTQYQGQ